MRQLKGSMGSMLFLPLFVTYCGHPMEVDHKSAGAGHGDSAQSPEFLTPAEESFSETLDSLELASAPAAVINSTRDAFLGDFLQSTVETYRKSASGFVRPIAGNCTVPWVFGNAGRTVHWKF